MAIVWSGDRPEPGGLADIGVEWGKGKDISVYTCHTCGLETNDRALFIQHCVAAHRAGVRLQASTQDPRR